MSAEGFSAAIKELESKCALVIAQSWQTTSEHSKCALLRLRSVLSWHLVSFAAMSKNAVIPTWPEMWLSEMVPVSLNATLSGMVKLRRSTAPASFPPATLLPAKWTQPSAPTSVSNRAAGWSGRPSENILTAARSTFAPQLLKCARVWKSTETYFCLKTSNCTVCNEGLVELCQKACQEVPDLMLNVNQNKHLNQSPFKLIARYDKWLNVGGDYVGKECKVYIHNTMVYFILAIKLTCENKWRNILSEHPSYISSL